MAQNQKSYDNEFKAQAVKLAQEIGGHKAAKELGIPDGTIYCWIKAFKEGRLSANEAVHSPMTALSLNDELIELRKRVKEQDKEIRLLKEENEFLEEASAMLDICSEDECNDTFPAKELFIVSCKKLVLITNQSVSLMALPKLIKKPGNQMI